MDRTEQVLVIVALAFVITLGITIAVVLNNQNNDGKTDDGSIDVVDDIGYDYSQYDVLKSIVQKLDANGGTITDIRGNELAFSMSRNFMLKDDLLIITSVDGGEMYIYHIHDIRSIRVN